MKRLHDEGGGVLLYLAQEGRGIGLANKLRAYQLQDDGLDTVDADRHLGFNADERSYAIAAAMLRQLGFTRIRLLTNSPHKLRELRERALTSRKWNHCLQRPMAQRALHQHDGSARALDYRSTIAQPANLTDNPPASAAPVVADFKQWITLCVLRDACKCA